MARVEDVAHQTQVPFGVPLAGLFLGLLALLSIPTFAGTAHAATWFAPSTAAGDFAVHLIVNDEVKGTVSDPSGVLQKGSGPSFVAVDEPTGSAYVRVLGTKQFDQPGPPTVIIISLADMTVTGAITDSMQLLAPNTEDAGDMAVSPDGRYLYFDFNAVTNDLELQGADSRLVVVDAVTNDVVKVFTLGSPALPTLLLISPDNATAYVRGVMRVSANNVLEKVYAVDLSTGTITASVDLPADPDPLHDHNVGFILSHDGSTLYVVDGRQILTIDTTTFSMSPIGDPDSDIHSPFGLAQVGSTLYVGDASPNPGASPMPAFVDVVTVDTATRTATGVIPVAPPTLVPAPLDGVVAASDDGTEVFVGYEHASPPGHLVNVIAIIDPSTNTLRGNVAGSVPLGGVLVDPYRVTPAIACAAGKQRVAGKNLASKMKCYSKAIAKGTPVDPGCLSNADAVLEKKFVPFGTACSGDAGSVEGLVNACVAAGLADDATAGLCAAKTAAVIGKSGNNLLVCGSKNVLKPGTLNACNAKQDTKLQVNITKAGSCAQPTLTTDLHACVTTILDGLPVLAP